MVEELIVVEDAAAADALEEDAAAADTLEEDADAAILDAMAAGSIDPVAALDEVDTAEADPMVVVPVPLEDSIGAPTS